MKVVGQFVVAVLAVCVLLTGCSKKKESTQAQQQTNATSEVGNPLTAPVDYLGAMGAAKKAAVKVTDLATVNRAIQMFNTMEGRYPKDLNELITQRYLPKLPAPPYRTRYDYNPQTGQVRLVRQ